MGVDFLAAGSQKWLLGPMGAGVLFVRKELAGRVGPLAIGAYSVAKPEPYGEIDYTLAPDCRRHESGTPPLPSLAGLRAAVELLLGAGIDAVAGRIHDLTDRLVAGLAGHAFRVVSPRDDTHWSGIVSFLPPTDGIDLEALCRRLRKERRIEILVRENRLRASPHFYNTGRQIDALVTAVAELATTRAGG
jgi:selenocysteine lyase/cysteine desulfurase